MLFEVAGRASVGRRSDQQDAYGIWTGAAPTFDEAIDVTATGAVIAVADGMGGHVGGAVASRTACGGFMAAMRSSRGDTVARLIDGVRRANEVVGMAGAMRRELAGMGTTLVGVGLGDGRLCWASVGDSHLFLWRKGRLYQLNADHSGKPMLRKKVAAEVMTEDGARHHPDGSRLDAALVGGALSAIDRSAAPLAVQDGDVIILSSDGVDTLAHDQIARLCDQASDSAASVAEGLLAAIGAADDAEQDNTTLAVARVLGNGETGAVPGARMPGEAGAFWVVDGVA